MRNSGRVVESHTLPIAYRNHLHGLSVKDSWGHQLTTLADTTENQTWTVYVPANSKYAWISAQPYGYNDSYGEGRTSTELIVDGEVVAQGFSASYRFTPDWQAHEEGYVVEIRIKDPDSLYHTNPASYTITLKQGGWDYTPDVQIVSSRGRGMLLQGSEPTVLTAQVSVTGPEGAEDISSCTYQWYYYIEDKKGNKSYTEIEGATEASYTVATDAVMENRYYVCRVSYEKDGQTYTAESNTQNFHICQEKVESPVVKTQPQNVQHVLGRQEVVQLEIALEASEDINADYLEATYQWYRSTDADLTHGILIDGATKPTYRPAVEEEGTVYYYCKVQYKRDDWNKDTGWEDRYSYSEEVCSDFAKVEVVTEAFPWEGSGSEKDPYQLKTVADLEALREKVNTDGYSFDGMHFRMTADITLSSDWTPIGALAAGHGLSENGKYLWAFSGILDGANHTLTMSDGGKPLFNYVRNATIENLKLYGKNINGYGLVDRYTVDYGTDGDYTYRLPDRPH